jgi:hypothetical protein
MTKDMKSLTNTFAFDLIEICVTPLAQDTGVSPVLMAQIAGRSEANSTR